MGATREVPLTAKQRGKTAPAKLAHIVYKTSRYEKMIEWYQVVLEAEIMSASDLVTFLTYDDEHHRIAVANMPGLAARPFQSAGVEHCAFTYACLEDLLATYERLKLQDITPYWTINHGPTLSFYYRDPDNNQIELQIDIFESNEKINAWLAQSDFTSNPIGVTFEPEALIARYRAGETTDSLLARPVIDPAELVNHLPRPPSA